MTVSVDRRDGIFEITLDRPKANAIDAATSRALGSAFVEFRDDPAYRVAILTGSGDRFFSAGWDLEAAAHGEAIEADYGEGGFGGFAELPGLNKPVIAAVNGMAVGGGFELVLAADFVVTADTAEFFFGEVAVGIIPDSGTIRLPRMLPPALAKELLLTGRRMGAEEAVHRGLVNAVCSRDRLMDSARELADRLASAAPLAVAAVLEAMQTVGHLSIPEAYHALRDAPSYQAMLGSEDALEGPRAFAEGRDPVWRGQ
ncbi:MAG: crotonobetainyl-CoA hydratase [Acidimicrobiia bacterium]|nr:crotonobetainyl-CoA hydratase [Acidimicrobiia bacterium]